MMNKEQVAKAVENLIKLYAEQNNVSIEVKEKATSNEKVH